MSRVGVLLFSTVLALFPLASAAEDAWTGMDRVVAVGDLHGDYEQTIAVLRSAGLIDDNLNWAGGQTCLVQNGDVVDRGPAPRKIMDLLMKLESQAKEQGGYVHCLIGNHEAMNLQGDFRYVSPEAFAEFSKPDKPSPSDLGHPPGYTEYKRQLSPDGTYGRWIRKHNVAIRIGDTIFVHGGIGPKFVKYSLRELNDRAREELSHLPARQDGVLWDPEGPLWYRGMARGNEEILRPVVLAVLNGSHAARIVIGHTFTDGAVTPNFGGKIIMIDIGLARLYDQFTRLACLVIEHGKPYALHRGTRLELPADDGPDLLRYLKEAARLDPQPSALLARIQTLEKRLTAGTTAPPSATADRP